MPNTKVDHAQALQDVKAAWASRGFRPDYLAHHQFEKDGDPSGELAYQRAFAEAAKKKPPRLPNPSHYANSPSAQTLLTQRTQALFSTSSPTTSAPPNPKYETPIPDYWRSRGDSSASSSPAHSQHTSMPPPPPPQLPAQNGYHQMNGHTNGHVPSPGHSQMTSPVVSRLLPHPMEPKMGAPMGPPSRFR